MVSVFDALSRVLLVKVTILLLPTSVVDASGSIIILLAVCEPVIVDVVPVAPAASNNIFFVASTASTIDVTLSTKFLLLNVWVVVVSVKLFLYPTRLLPLIPSIFVIVLSFAAPLSVRSAKVGLALLLTSWPTNEFILVPFTSSTFVAESMVLFVSVCGAATRVTVPPKFAQLILCGAVSAVVSKVTGKFDIILLL